MPIDKSIISTLNAAIEQNPANTALRLHLISLLGDEQAVEALTHCKFILGYEPDNLEALKFATNAAKSSGDKVLSEKYHKLFVALSGETETPPEKSRQLQPLETISTVRDDDKWSETIFDDNGDDDDENVNREKIGLRESGDDDFIEDGEPFWETETPKIKLEDVAGMETVKRRLNLAFLAPLKNPEMMKLYGKSLRGGLLLYGPPGCGKTFIARATAGELGAKFMSVGLSDVLDMWIGSSEKNIHQIFERARRNAPCVLFFDEIDALGRKRSLTRNAQHGSINQLLAELDGVNHDNNGVFVLAATNHPWDVDTALRRPGRLDRTLLVLPPDAPAREAIIELTLRSRPTDKSIDLNFIAQKTNEFSGADLTHLVESAAELAMEDSIVSGNVRSITQNDFKKALREVKPSTRPWFEVAKNYAMFSNEGGTYDDLLEYLRTQRLI